VKPRNRSTSTLTGSCPRPPQPLHRTAALRRSRNTRKGLHQQNRDLGNGEAAEANNKPRWPDAALGEGGTRAKQCKNYIPVQRATAFALGFSPRPTPSRKIALTGQEQGLRTQGVTHFHLSPVSTSPSIQIATLDDIPRRNNSKSKTTVVTASETVQNETILSTRCTT
jgi:hypothetical protein